MLCIVFKIPRLNGRAGSSPALGTTFQLKSLLLFNKIQFWGYQVLFFQSVAATPHIFAPDIYLPWSSSGLVSAPNSAYSLAPT